jgi:hypothetical protein
VVINGLEQSFNLLTHTLSEYEEFIDPVCYDGPTFEDFKEEQHYGRYAGSYAQDDMGYSDGYVEGYDEGYDAAYIGINNEDSLIVSAYELGQVAGHAAGALGEYPVEDSVWQYFKDNNNFVDAYVDYYFDAYNYWAEIDYDGAFNHEVIYMIDTSKESETIEAVGYDDWFKVLLIKWTEKGLYAYKDVDRDVFEALIFVEEIEESVNENHIEEYEYYKIEG